MDTEPRFTTRQAVDYLTKAGFPVSKPTLERYRAKGTGPVYLRIARGYFILNRHWISLSAARPFFRLTPNHPQLQQTDFP